MSRHVFPVKFHGVTPKGTREMTKIRMNLGPEMVLYKICSPDMVFRPKNVIRKSSLCWGSASEIERHNSKVYTRLEDKYAPVKPFGG